MSLVIEQLTTFFILLGVGLFMAFVFDIYRVSRNYIRLPKFIYHIIDLLIWLILALVVFAFLLISNWGELRFYIFISLTIGVGVYFLFFSKYVIAFLIIIIEAWIRLVKIVARFLWFPFGLLGRILGLKKLKDRLERAIRELLSKKQ